MSHFYGVIEGRVRNSSRTGSKAHGLITMLYTRNGAIKVRVWYDRASDKDHYEIMYVPHMNYTGERIVLSEGLVADILKITGAQA